MNLGYRFLKTLLKEKNEDLTSLGKLLGVTPQAVHSWVKNKTIPNKRVLQISEIFNLTDKEFDQLLGNEPLEFCFRTKEGKELNSSEVSDAIKVRAETIYERFFTEDHKNHKIIRTIRTIRLANPLR